MDDLSSALTTTRIKFDDIIDSTWAFDNAEEALQYLWEGKQVGKVVIQIWGMVLEAGGAEPTKAFNHLPATRQV